MPDIKKYFQLPVWIYLSLAAIVIILLLFLVNFLVYHNQTELFLSTSKLKIEGNNITLAFNLDKTELPEFKNLASNLGSSWQGETISLTVNESLSKSLEKFNDLTIFLNPDKNSLKLKTTKITDLITVSHPLWIFTLLVPEDAVFYLEGKNLEIGLPQIVKNLNLSLTEQTALSLFPVKDGMGVVWFKKVLDKRRLAAEIEKIKSTSLEASSSASLTRVEDGVVDTVKVSKLITERGSIFFLGQIDDKLVITTTEDSFRTIVAVKNHRQGNLMSSFLFSKNEFSLGKSGLAALFIGNNLKVTGNNLKNLQTIFSLKGQGLEMTQTYFDKISSLLLIINPENELKGVVKFR